MRRCTYRVDAVKSQLLQQTVNKQTCWMAPDIAGTEGNRKRFALPGFDEFLLGYKDRSAVLDTRHAQQCVPAASACSPRPSSSTDACRTWKRSIRKTAIEIGATPFSR